MPPSCSIATETSLAVGRLVVPLNSMCSTKWQIPCDRVSSKREPTPTKIAELTDRAEGRVVVTMRSPLSSSVRWYKVPGLYGRGRPGRPTRPYVHIRAKLSRDGRQGRLTPKRREEIPCKPTA